MHLYSSFLMDTVGFFLWANLYKNCYFFVILADIRPHC